MLQRPVAAAFVLAVLCACASPAIRSRESADAGADGGLEAPCNPGGPEACFNGQDDDCNGLVDCEDTACEPTAMCVPGGASTGILVGQDDDCPEGYTAHEQVLHRGLSGGCTGCSCEVTPTTCSAALHVYPMEGSSDSCSDDTGNVGGSLHTITVLNNNWNDPNDTSCPNPVEAGAVSGWRLANVSQTDGACTPVGTAAPEEASWSAHAKLCTPRSVGQGCGDGRACVPVVDRARICHQEALDCPGERLDWYGDFEDHRTCGSCSCTDGEGGNCADIKVKIGDDWMCLTDRGLVGPGEKQCIGAYAPPAFLVGTPVDKTCIPSALVSGSLEPTGRVDLCCVDL